MRIDVHAHYFPPAYLATLERLGSTSTAAVRHAPGAGLSIDGRLDLMARAGIDRQVLSVGPQLPSFEDRAASLDAARQANDAYADLVGRHPGRFAAFATLPLPHVDAALAEADRCLTDLGCLGVALGCSVRGRPLDDPAFAPLFADLDRRGSVVFLHPTGAGAGPNTADFGLTWMIGAPVEDTVAALRLVLSGMLDRYPRLRVVVPHLGGTLPFLLQRLDDAADRQRAVDPLPIEGAPSSRVRRLWFDTVNQHPAALRCAWESVGPERLLLGTDFPYLSGEKFERCVSYVREAGLPAADVDTILDRSAEHLLYGAVGGAAAG